MEAVSTVAEAHGQVTTGYWPAAFIGAVLLLTLIVTTTRAVIRRRWPRYKRVAVEPAVRPLGAPPSNGDVPLERCCGLIAEALIVRERMSGQIDAETYRAHMNDLAREPPREGRAHRNAR